MDHFQTQGSNQTDQWRPSPIEDQSNQGPQHAPNTKSSPPIPRQISRGTNRPISLDSVLRLHLKIVYAFNSYTCLDLFKCWINKIDDQN